ncbi:hypothetical protein B0A52_08972 [Exophiala mesophila]|uniref:C2H2-type domain-containing protein n=1 Tax=Exophiala mesophila TaxID=212818 RepID=A0A438MV62_EXOME|nr:hypothetical protein B0A52_08972 [Exophiala mesophila]
MQTDSSRQLQGLVYTFSANPSTDSNAQTKDSEKPRKKRHRGANGKRFRCSNQDCGKTYSRAEHLQRHQLNHDPKEIFYCGTSGCNLSFVRKDLCDRHRKRHGQQFSDGPTSSTAITLFSGSEDINHSQDEGDTESDSQSEEEHPSPPSQSNSSQAPVIGDSCKKRPSIHEHDDSRFQALRDRLPIPSKTTKESAPQSRDASQSQQPSRQPENTFSTDISPSNDDLQRAVADANDYLAQQGPQVVFPPLTRFQSNISVDSLDPTPSTSYHAHAEFPLTFHRQHSISSTSFQPPSHLYTPAQDVATPHPDLFESTSPATLRHNGTFGKYGHSNDITATTSRAEDQNFGISPSAGTDEFTTWLFDQNSGVYNGTANADASFTNVYQPNVFGQVYSSYLPTSDLELPFASTLTQTLPSNPTAEAVTGLETPFMSTWKRQNLLEIMRQRFTGNGGPTLHDRQIKQQIFGGNVDEADHALSLSSLNRYLESYWKHFHDQFPILHKPSFLPDFVHDYLVLAVIVMGSSLLAQSEHGPGFTERAAQLANFIAWNLRWQVFTDPDSCPPAKLWVLQTLAILEVYEKTNSTRSLHERAHVHFAATLTLMRRGSALVGDPAAPAPTPQMADIVATNREEALQGEESPPLPEKWWSQWIAQEATRRASLGAFLLDSMHAVMFGHAATMVIHEIHLPLPCDDTLWSAPTSSEVGRIEFSLYTNGIKPVTFLTGLKRTLSCRRVRTNPFGRIILMAGLLSVSWHMHQRDLYGKSLDKDNMGVPDGWKAQIVKALEWWKRDYDESLAYMRRSGIDVHKTGFTQEHIQTSESLASVLYHLGHIGVQVDMPDLCILAGAKTLLGRVITMSDRERVHIKMKAWASSAAARHAVYYSVRFICSVLMPLERMGHKNIGTQPSDPESNSIYLYSASADFLLPRPWVLYFSALVVWAYGFLLDGPLKPFPEQLRYPGASIPTPLVDGGGGIAPSLQMEPLREREQDAKQYLRLMSRFETATGFETVTSGRNKVIGVLSVVSKVLEGSRWELLEEGCDRLRGAAEALRSGGL